MSFFGQPKQSADGDASLSDVLTTPVMRTELVAVIALCSDAMRRDLCDVFEPAKRRHNASQSRAKATDDLIDFEGTEDTDEKNVGEVVDRERADLDSPSTRALRRAALTYFDKWQVDVLRRLGEVLSVRADAVRRARAEAKKRAEALARARQDQAYLNWANGVDGEPPNHSPTDTVSSSETDILPEGFGVQIVNLAKEKRVLILNSVLLLLLSLETYTAHSRVLMRTLSLVLRLPESTLIENESKVAEGLLASAAAKMSADDSTKRQASEDASTRKWKIGLATVAGAALIGVTGGLAAPILAAGVGSIMGGLGLGAVASLLGPLATNMVLVGGLFGAYGGRMTGRIMEKYAQEIKDFRFLPVSCADPEHVEPDAATSQMDGSLEQMRGSGALRTHKLRVAIGISGSVTDAKDFVQPWRVFSESRIEPFGLRWEMDALLKLGRKISETVKSFAWDFAKFHLLSMILAGLWPFGLLRAAGSLDSPFAIAKTRSDKAGKVLADALIHKVQGERPVTLVGYGLGARLIYSCLLALADQNVFGLVESVVLMGTPAPCDAASWRRIRAVVSGRVVNVFSDNDFVLGFLYRASSVQMGIAGVQEVGGVKGVENYDFTDMVKSHQDYRHLIGTILQRVGFADLDNEAVRQQQQALNQAQERSREQKRAAETRGTDEDTDAAALARQDELGHIVIVDDEKAVPNARFATQEDKKDTREHIVTPKHWEDDLEDEENDGHAIKMEDNEEPMSMLEPEPEPDLGPDRETVRFGSGVRGFDIEWDKNR